MPIDSRVARMANKKRHHMLKTKKNNSIAEQVRSVNKKQTVCLNMIVKNESHCIETCLNQMRPYIDCYCIIDTGSTDDTPEIIRKYFEQYGVPGKVIVHDFKTCSCHSDSERTSYFDFARNRTYAIEQCYGMSDYLFLMDADDTIQGDFNLNWSQLDVGDTYYLKMGSPGFTYWRPLIFRNRRDYGYHFRCPIHEYLTSKLPTKRIEIKGNYYIESGRSGARNQDPYKYQRDAEILEDAILKEGKDSSDYYRLVFYCAQSWKDANKVDRAIELYRERAEASVGWNEERYYSYYQLALLKQQAKHPWSEIEKVCLDAMSCGSKRSETHHLLATHYLESGDLEQANKYAKQGVKIPFPENGLFVFRNIYKIELPWIYATISAKLQQTEEAKFYYRTVLPYLSGNRKQEAETYLEKYNERPSCAVVVEMVDLIELGLGVVKECLNLLDPHFNLVIFSDYLGLPYRTYNLDNSHTHQNVFQLVLFARTLSKEFLNSIELSSKYVGCLTSEPLYRFGGSQCTVYRIKNPEVLDFVPESSSFDLKELERLAQLTGEKSMRNLVSICNRLECGEHLIPESYSYLSQQERLAIIEDESDQPATARVVVEKAKLYVELGKWTELMTLYETYLNTNGRVISSELAEVSLLYAKALMLQEDWIEGYKIASATLATFGRSDSLCDFFEAEKIRDQAVPHVMKLTEKYPKEIIEKLKKSKISSPEYMKEGYDLSQHGCPITVKSEGSCKMQPRVMFSITTCKRYDLFSKTINSFLNCCTDYNLISDWFCVDDNSSEEDRQKMRENYPFFRFYWKGPDEKGHSKSMNIIYSEVTSSGYDYLLHLEDDWHYVESRNYVGECLQILEAHPNYLQVLHNRNTLEVPNYERPITGGELKLEPVRHVLHKHFRQGSWHRNLMNSDPKLAFGSTHNGSPSYAGNVYYWPNFSFRPGLIRVSGLTKVGYFSTDGFFEMDYAIDATSLSYRLAFLDTFACYHIGRKTWERNNSNANINAYTLNAVEQFGLTKGQQVKLVAVTTRQWTEVWAKFKKNHYQLSYSVFRSKFEPVPEISFETSTVQAAIDWNRRAQLRQFVNTYRNTSGVYVFCRDNVQLENWEQWCSRVGESGLMDMLPVGSVLTFESTDRFRSLEDYNILVMKLDNTVELNKIYMIKYSDTSYPLKFTICESFKTSEELEANDLSIIDGYEFYPSIDSCGGDALFQSYWKGEDDTPNQEKISNRVKKWAETGEHAFNTLGYVKNKIQSQPIRLPYVESLHDGIYIKKK